MITLYLRSSSEGTHNLCELKYFIEYVLGFDGGEGKAATKGTITHKVLELSAARKFAQQNGDSFYSDEETGIPNTPTTVFDTAKLLKHVFDYYNKRTKLGLTEADMTDCMKWVIKAETFENGRYNPYLRDVLCPELFFEIEMKEPWAAYSYKVGDEKIEGNLIVRGTMDLVTRLNDETIEYVDWKTGARKDWAKNSEKDYHSLRDDFQLRLYHFALKKHFPTYKYFLLTVFYINSGGPYTIHFGDDDIPHTIEIIKNTFLKIKNNTKPSMIKKMGKDYAWKCKFCNHSKNKYETCNLIERELIKLGMDKVTEKYIKLDKLHSYTGGGKTRE